LAAIAKADIIFLNNVVYQIPGPLVPRLERVLEGMRPGSFVFTNELDRLPGLNYNQFQLLGNGILRKLEIPVPDHGYAIADLVDAIGPAMTGRLFGANHDEDAVRVERNAALYSKALEAEADRREFHRLVGEGRIQDAEAFFRARPNKFNDFQWEPRSAVYPGGLDLRIFELFPDLETAHFLNLRPFRVYFQVEELDFLHGNHRFRSREALGEMAKEYLTHSAGKYIPNALQLAILQKDPQIGMEPFLLFDLERIGARNVRVTPLPQERYTTFRIDFQDWRGHDKHIYYTQADAVLPQFSSVLARDMAARKIDLIFHKGFTFDTSLGFSNEDARRLSHINNGLRRGGLQVSERAILHVDDYIEIGTIGGGQTVWGQLGHREGVLKAYRNAPMAEAARDEFPAQFTEDDPFLGMSGWLWGPLIRRGWVSLETAARWAFFAEEFIFSGVLLNLLPALLSATGVLDPALAEALRLPLFLTANLLFGLSHDRLYKRDGFGNVYDAGPARLRHRLALAGLGAIFRIGFLFGLEGPWTLLATLPLALGLHFIYNENVAPKYGLPLGMALEETHGSPLQYRSIGALAVEFVHSPDRNRRHLIAEHLTRLPNRAEVIKTLANAIRQMNPGDTDSIFNVLVFYGRDFSKALLQELGDWKPVRIHTTLFFRHAEEFEALRKSLPELIRQRSAEGAKALTALSLGASTGNEAVSIAAAFLSETQNHPEWNPLSLKVHGYEIDGPTVRQAQENLRTGWLDLGDSDNEQTYSKKVRPYLPQIRRDGMVEFHEGDITGGEAGGAVEQADIIFLNHVLYQMTAESHGRLAESLQKMRPGAILFTNELDYLRALDIDDFDRIGDGILRKRAAGEPPVGNRAAVTREPAVQETSWIKPKRSHVTTFFRYGLEFEKLQEVLPLLFRQRVAEGAKTVTAYSLGASNGKEAVSIAAAILSSAERNPDWGDFLTFEVHGVEDDGPTVDKARDQLAKGSYDFSNTEDRQAYAEKVHPFLSQIRLSGMVRFHEQDIFSPETVKGLEAADIVFINFVLYQQPTRESHRKMEAALSRLKPGAYVFTNEMEWLSQLDRSEFVTVIDKDHMTVLQKKPADLQVSPLKAPYTSPRAGSDALNSLASGRWAWVSNFWGEAAHAVTATLLGHQAETVWNNPDGAPYVRVAGLPQKGVRALILAAVHPAINFLWAISPFLWLAATGLPQGPPQIALFLAVSFHALLNAFGFGANVFFSYFRWTAGQWRFFVAPDSDWNRIFFAVDLSALAPEGKDLRSESDEKKPYSFANSRLTPSVTEAMAFLGHIDARPGDRILNVGTHLDFHTPLAAMLMGAHYVGYEVNRVYEKVFAAFFARLAMSRFTGSGKQVVDRFSTGSPASAELPDHSQDVVLMLGVLTDPHVQEPERIFMEALRVIKDNGTLVVGSYPLNWEISEREHALAIVNDVLVSSAWEGRVRLIFQGPYRNSRNSSYIFKVEFNEAVLETGEQ
ncbi:MAG: methyltransferase domain-containing protein, partial [Elusimicrobia bacterium]|nr:methyltransferase domain-containing protein [Elusimicrobiota bacterium]